MYAPVESGGDAPGERMSGRGQQPIGNPRMYAPAAPQPQPTAYVPQQQHGGVLAGPPLVQSQPGGVSFVSVDVPDYTFSPPTQRLARLVRMFATIDLVFQVLDLLFVGNDIALFAILWDSCGIYGARTFKRGYVLTYFVGATILGCLYLFQLLFVISVGTDGTTCAEEDEDFCQDIKDHFAELVISSILSMMIQLIAATFAFRFYKQLTSEAYFRAIQSPAGAAEAGAAGLPQMAVPVHAPGTVTQMAYPVAAVGGAASTAPGAPGYPTFPGTYAMPAGASGVNPGDPPVKPGAASYRAG